MSTAPSLIQRAHADLMQRGQAVESMTDALNWAEEICAFGEVSDLIAYAMRCEKAVAQQIQRTSLVSRVHQDIVQAIMMGFVLGVQAERQRFADLEAERLRTS